MTFNGWKLLFSLIDLLREESAHFFNVSSLWAPINQSISSLHLYRQLADVVLYLRSNLNIAAGSDSPLFIFCSNGLITHFRATPWILE